MESIFKGTRGMNRRRSSTNQRKNKHAKIVTVYYCTHSTPLFCVRSFAYQGVQVASLVAPVADECFPGSQAVQELSMIGVVSPYFPAWHGLQEVAPEPVLSI